MTRQLRAPAAALLLAFALTACSGALTVSADDVEAQAEEQFSAQFPVDSVDCPEDLAGEVDATIECVLVSEGTSFTMEATVREVDGTNVNFDLELTEEL